MAPQEFAGRCLKAFSMGRGVKKEPRSLRGGALFTLNPITPAPNLSTTAGKMPEVPRDVRPQGFLPLEQAQVPGGLRAKDSE